MHLVGNVYRCLPLIKLPGQNYFLNINHRFLLLLKPENNNVINFRMTFLQLNTLFEHALGVCPSVTPTFFH